jgi:hypothetical protein
MTKHVMFFLILSLLFYGSAFAQTAPAGTWQGKLAVSPNESMTIQFIITRQANGSYAALVNSPDTGAIKNVSATGVKFAAGKLTIDVANLNGSYSGTVGKGVITGEWKQEGSTLPLVLTPYIIPPVSTLKPLVGEWLGDFEPPGAAKMKAVAHFEISKDGKFNAFVDLPEQGSMGTPISDVRLEGTQVSFKVAGGAAEYTGKLIANKIEGMVKQGGQEIKLNLAKGKYEVPGFAMPAESMKRLLGEWAGNTEPSKMAIVFRFETTSSGKLAVFMDVPDQRVKGVPVKDFTFNADQITIKLPGLSGDTYTGQISGNSMKGTFKLNNNDQELNLAKGKYRPNH